METYRPPRVLDNSEIPMEERILLRNIETYLGTLTEEQKIREVALRIHKSGASDKITSEAGIRKYSFIMAVTTGTPSKYLPK